MAYPFEDAIGQVCGKRSADDETGFDRMDFHIVNIAGAIDQALAQREAALLKAMPSTAVDGDT